MRGNFGMMSFPVFVAELWWPFLSLKEPTGIMRGLMSSPTLVAELSWPSTEACASCVGGFSLADSAVNVSFRRHECWTSTEIGAAVS